MHDLAKDEACPHCGRYDNRATTIDAVIIKDNRVLLIKRGSEPDRGKWATPGGYIAWDEDLEQTVTREVKEETGLSVKSLKFISFSSEPTRHPKQTINHVYLIEAEGKLKAGDDAIEAKWFDINKIPKDLAFDNNKSIEEAKKIVAQV